MTASDRIRMADQDIVDGFAKETQELLNAMEHPEALVTDLSQVSDFLLGAFDAEAESSDEALLGRLSQLMGRPVRANERLGEMARELHTRQTPPTVH